MKKLLSVLALSAISVQAQSEVQNPELYKQLEIMNDIVRSAVNREKTKEGFSIGQVKSTYLRGQGVVFTVNARTNLRGSRGHHFVMPPMPELPPMPHIDGADYNIDFDVNQVVAEAMESASESYSEAIEHMEHLRDEQRQIQEQQRDVNYDYRDVTREMKDLEFQRKRADKETLKAIEKEMAKLKAQKADLEKQRSELKRDRQAYVDKQAKAQHARAEQRVNGYQELSENLIEAFCTYGNSLKALPKSERINLVVNSSGDKKGNGYLDTIYTFTKAEVMSCVIGDIDAAALMKKGAPYQF